MHTASGQGAHMIVKNGHITFEASRGYRATQQHFQSLVLTYDPRLIADMLQQTPHHVDALLAYYDFLVSSEQNQEAYACLRRALFVLESWLSPAFKDALGTASCKFAPFALKPDALRDDWGEDAGLNGALIRALTLAMRLAGRRDCYEAALALNKLVVSLDPLSDPSFSCLALDYYALRAGQARWLVDNRKIANWDPAVLPNAAFGRALALFVLDERARADDECRAAVRRWSGYVVELNLGGFDVVLPWLNKHRIKDTVADRLVRVAAMRHANLWKDPRRVAWLLDNVKAVASSGALSDFPAHAAAVQQFYALAVLSDFNDVVAIIPRDEAPAVAAAEQVAPVAQDHGTVARLIEFLAGVLMPVNHTAAAEEDDDDAD